MISEDHTNVDDAATTMSISPDRNDTSNSNSGTMPLRRRSHPSSSSQSVQSTSRQSNVPPPPPRKLRKFRKDQSARQKK